MLEFTRSEIIMLVAPTVLFIVVLELVRSRRLREDYSLLWLVTFGVMVVLAVFRDTLLDTIAGVLGIFYPPTALFVIGVGLSLMVLLQLTMVITRLATQNRRAAQEIALLSARVGQLERQLTQSNQQ